MSKIQITELNKYAPEFNTLNDQEITKVVGGYYGSNYSYTDTYVSVFAVNDNFNQQITLGGGRFSDNGNSNYTSQGNNVTVY